MRKRRQKKQYRSICWLPAATIVTMDPDRRVIEDGFIAVKGDSIVAIGPSADDGDRKG